MRAEAHLAHPQPARGIQWGEVQARLLAHVARCAAQQRCVVGGGAITARVPNATQRLYVRCVYAQVCVQAGGVDERGECVWGMNGLGAMAGPLTGYVLGSPPLFGMNPHLQHCAPCARLRDACRGKAQHVRQALARALGQRHEGRSVNAMRQQHTHAVALAIGGSTTCTHICVRAFVSVRLAQHARCRARCTDEGKHFTVAGMACIAITIAGMYITIAGMHASIAGMPA